MRSEEGLPKRSDGSTRPLLSVKVRCRRNSRQEKESLVEAWLGALDVKGSHGIWWDF